MNDFNICDLIHIKKLDNIVNKYNNTYHSKIKMYHVDVKPSTHIDFDKKNNNIIYIYIYIYTEFKVGDNVRILKHKIVFEKG